MTTENEFEPTTNTPDNNASDEKKRSNLNALRDLLSGQVTVMTEEDRVAHDIFTEAIINDLAPKGAMEIQLAQRVATDSWRLNRLSAIEDNIFALGFNQFGGEQCLEHVQIDAALTAARVFMRDAKQIQLLTLYEQRINRAIQKNLALLQSLQSTRKAEAKQPAPAEQPQASPAAPAAKAAKQQVPPAAPPANGFVLSNTEIQPTPDLDDHTSPGNLHLPARAA